MNEKIKIKNTLEILKKEMSDKGLEGIVIDGAAVINDNGTTISDATRDFVKEAMKGLHNVTFEFHLIFQNLDMKFFDVLGVEDQEESEKTYTLLFKDCSFQSFFLEDVACDRLNLHFVNCDFEGDFNIHQKSIVHNLTIQDSAIKGKFDCKDIEVQGKTSIIHSEIEKTSNFYNASFGVALKGSKDGSSDEYAFHFEASKFNVGAIFDQATFYGQARFPYGNFLGATNVFRNTTFYQAFDFSTTNFQGALPNFYGIKLGEGNDWEEFFKGVITQLPESTTSQEAILRDARETFRILKTSFESAKNFIAANHFYALEMKAYALELRVEKKPSGSEVEIEKKPSFLSGARNFLFEEPYFLIRQCCHLILDIFDKDKAQDKAQDKLIFFVVGFTTSFGQSPARVFGWLLRSSVLGGFASCLISAFLCLKAPLNNAGETFLFLFSPIYKFPVGDVALLATSTNGGIYSVYPLLFVLFLWKGFNLFLSYQFINAVRQKTRRS